MNQRSRFVGMSPDAGFTFLELIVVMALVGLLVVSALPAYQDATTRAREAVLHQDLLQMRKSLEEYLVDKGAYPANLQLLVDDGYLREIPLDPFTGAADTWIEELVPWMLVEQGQPIGVWQVRSGADGTALDGTRYAEW